MFKRIIFFIALFFSSRLIFNLDIVSSAVDDKVKSAESLNIVTENLAQKTNDLHRSERAKKSDFQLAQTFHYSRQQARLDYAFKEGKLTKDRSEYLLGETDVFYWNSLLTYQRFTLFYRQSFFLPKIILYDLKSSRFMEENIIVQYHGELGLFYHLGFIPFLPLRIGASYLLNGADDLLKYQEEILEQRLQLASDNSINLYAGIDVPIFTWPIHVVGDLRINTKPTLAEENFIYDISSGLLILPTYYFSVTMRYRAVLSTSKQLERHMLQFLFNYRVLEMWGLNVEYATILYSEGEAPLSVFSLGLHLFFDW